MIRNQTFERGFFTEKELAALLDMSISCLRRLRSRGEIAYVKVRNKIYYTAAHVEEFMKRYTVDPFSPDAQANKSKKKNDLGKRPPKIG